MSAARTAPSPTAPHRLPASGSFWCCGVRIDVLPLDVAAEEIVRSASTGAVAAVHLCNAYSLALAERDPAFRRSLNRGDLNLPDGMPLVWAARRLGFDQLRSRVYGPQLMQAVVDRGRSRRLRHYLYGSTPAVVERLATSLRARYPGVEIVAAESPPFRPLEPDEADALVARVQAAEAGVVWVGLGTPTQDRFVDELRTRLGTTLVAVGAAFDFLAGTKPQAPGVLQELGLEWAYRLACEPRRLWRRYLLGNLVFLAGLARHGLATAGGTGPGPAGEAPPC